MSMRFRLLIGMNVVAVLALIGTSGWTIYKLDRLSRAVNEIPIDGPADLSREPDWAERLSRDLANVETVARRAEDEAAKAERHAKAVCDAISSCYAGLGG